MTAGGGASRPSRGMLAIPVNLRKLTILETFGWPSLAWDLSGVFHVSWLAMGVGVRGATAGLKRTPGKL